MKKSLLLTELLFIVSISEPLLKTSLLHAQGSKHLSLKRFLLPCSHHLLPMGLQGREEREGNAWFPDSNPERAAI